MTRSAPKYREAVAIFARAPLPGKVKTRLVPLLGARVAAGFQAALISDIVGKVEQVRGVARYFFFAGSKYPVRFSLRRYAVKRQLGGGLGQRLERAFRDLLRSHARAVVIGSDVPLLRPTVLRQALGELRVCDAVLGPCPDGGYFLIGLRSEGRGLPRGIFRGIRWGSEFAFRDTLQNILGKHLSCSILEPVGDIDRPEDIWALWQVMTRLRRARRLAAATWRFLKSCNRIG